MSYKAEFIADDSGKWAGNGLRFATEAEAKIYAADLANRWLLVTATRTIESDEAANYEIADGFTLRRIES